MNNTASRISTGGHSTQADRAAGFESVKNGHVYPKNRQMLAPTQNRWAVYVVDKAAPICQLVEVLCLQETLDSQNNISTRIINLTPSTGGTVMSQAFENPEENENFVGYITRQERPTEQELIAFATSFTLAGDKNQASSFR